MAATIIEKDGWRLDVSCNFMGGRYAKLACVACGRKRKRSERVDTEDVWEDLASYCWNCWCAASGIRITT